MAMRTLVVVLCGIPGSGKTVLRRRLQSFFQKQILFLKEPDHLKIKNKSSEEEDWASPLAEMLGGWAQRCAFWEQEVVPALKKGIPVFIEEGDASSFARAHARGSNSEEHEFWKLRRSVFGRYPPTQYVFLDVRPRCAWSRKKPLEPDQHPSVFFLERMHTGFSRFFFNKNIAGLVTHLDGEQGPPVVFREVKQLLQATFSSFKK